MRGDQNNESDNKAIVRQIVSQRCEKARLLGYPTHADSVLEMNMARTPAASILDMAWHEMHEPQLQVGVDEFEARTMTAASLIPEIVPRYRRT